MTYREPDVERAQDRLAIAEAANLDEAAAVRAMTSRRGLMVLRGVTAVLIWIGVTIASAFLGALVGYFTGGIFDVFGGILLGGFVGLILGIVLAVVFVLREPQRG